MKYTAIALVLIMLAGCSNNEQTEVTQQFWDAMTHNDWQTVRTLVVDKEHVDDLASDRIHLTPMKYTVLEASDNSVAVRFSRSCFSDFTAPTKLTSINGKTRVNLMETLRAQFAIASKQEPTQKYCYNFEDHQLSGVINGSQWTAHHASTYSIPLGDHSETSRIIVSEPCDDPYCMDLRSPRLIISHLNLNDTGGNLSSEENVTIYVPPNHNIVVTHGSYRISQTDDNHTKLELTVDKDSNNHLSGFVYLN